MSNRIALISTAAVVAALTAGYAYAQSVPIEPPDHVFDQGVSVIPPKHVHTQYAPIEHSVRCLCEPRQQALHYHRAVRVVHHESMAPHYTIIIKNYTAAAPIRAEAALAPPSPAPVPPPPVDYLTPPPSEQSPAPAYPPQQVMYAPPPPPPVVYQPPAPVFGGMPYPYGMMRLPSGYRGGYDGRHYR